jgi:3-hydroxybutyryl-CoA dehydrogenase
MIACVGAGRMGRGMAHAFAYAGHDVHLVDAKVRTASDFETLAHAAMGEVRSSLTMLAALGQFDASAVDTIVRRIKIFPRDDAGRALTDAAVIFEGVPETEPAKRDAFALIDQAANAGAIVASTTSTFLSTLVAGWTSRPAQFLNAHWLNPAYLIPLVEVSPHEGTDPAVTKQMTALLEGIGKVPIVCKASPGYIIPRIQVLAMNEAARMAEEGVASVEDIDKAITYGFGFRYAVLGLLEFIDAGGGDILYYASRYMASATGEDRFKAPKVIEDNMAEGRTGLRTGKGFYDWAGRDIDAYRRERLGDLLGMLQKIGKDRPPVL